MKINSNLARHPHYKFSNLLHQYTKNFLKIALSSPQNMTVITAQ